MRRSLSPVCLILMLCLATPIVASGPAWAKGGALDAETARQRLGRLGSDIVAREDRLRTTRRELQQRRRDATSAKIRLAAADQELRKLSRAAQRLAREPVPAILLHPSEPLDAARSAMLLRRLSRTVVEKQRNRSKELAKLQESALAAERAEALLLADLRTLRAEEAEVKRLQRLAKRRTPPAQPRLAPQSRPPQEAATPRRSEKPPSIPPSALRRRYDIADAAPQRPPRLADRMVSQDVKSAEKQAVAKAADAETRRKKQPEKQTEKRPEKLLAKRSGTPEKAAEPKPRPQIAQAPPTAKDVPERTAAAKPKASPAPPLPRLRIPKGRRFSKSRGELLWPAAADMRRSGRKGDPSISFFTRPYARVIAPWRGVVRHVGALGSEKIVIIEPQNGYSILISGLESIDLSTGQKVAAGQPIGRMGGPAEWRDEFLYEERPGALLRTEKLDLGIYRNDRPLNAAKWFRAATERVSGL